MDPTLVLLGGVAAAFAALFYMNQDGPNSPLPPPNAMGGPKTSPASPQAAFVKLYGPIAGAVADAHGWTSKVGAVLVGWAAMESNYGRSRLALEGNNLFGIKAGPTWKAEGRPFVNFPTQEYQGTPGQIDTAATFRKYGDWTESTEDLIKLLSSTTIYKPAYDALTRGDLQGFYQAINASGYSTASNYAARISGAVAVVSSIA